MVNIDINKKIYDKWLKFYDTHDKTEYPTIKNFSEKKFLEIMKPYNI